MNGIDIGRHLSDGEIVRYIDERASDQTPREWREHVERCARCDRSARALEEESRLVSDWLDRADFEGEGSAGEGVLPLEARGATEPYRAASGSGSRSLTMGPWLRAAAVLVLLAAPVAALPGVRTWVTERVTGGAEAASTDATAAASAEEGTVLRFAPAPGEFEVRFTAGSEGSIRVDRSDEEEAVLISIGGAPETVVSSSALEIRNPEPGRYHLRLPVQTTGAWIRVEGRAVTVSDRQIDQGTVVEIQPR